MDSRKQPLFSARSRGSGKVFQADPYLPSNKSLKSLRYEHERKSSNWADIDLIEILCESPESVRYTLEYCLAKIHQVEM